MTQARIVERGIWFWIVGAPGGAWHGYPFPSRSDAAEALEMEMAR
jgi:hypothetical protein